MLLCAPWPSVSCSATAISRRRSLPKGIFLEQLRKNPARFLPEAAPAMSPADWIWTRGWTRCQDSGRSIRSRRLNLRGNVDVARDIAHARIKQMLYEGKPMPDYFKKHPVYHAGPAKTPEGRWLGSFGPTTAGRMGSLRRPVPVARRFYGDGGQGNQARRPSPTPAEARRAPILGSIGGAGGDLGQELDQVGFP